MERDVERERCRKRDRNVERVCEREEEGVCLRQGERTDHSLGCLANFSFTNSLEAGGIELFPNMIVQGLALLL